MIFGADVRRRKARGCCCSSASVRLVPSRLPPQLPAPSSQLCSSGYRSSAWASLRPGVFTAMILMRGWDRPIRLHAPSTHTHTAAALTTPAIDPCFTLRSEDYLTSNGKPYLESENSNSEFWMKSSSSLHTQTHSLLWQRVDEPPPQMRVENKTRVWSCKKIPGEKWWRIWDGCIQHGCFPWKNIDQVGEDFVWWDGLWLFCPDLVIRTL